MLDECMSTKYEGSDTEILPMYSDKNLPQYQSAPPQIPHKLSEDWTWVFVMTGRWQTAWTMKWTSTVTISSRHTLWFFTAEEVSCQTQDMLPLRLLYYSTKVIWWMPVIIKPLACVIHICENSCRTYTECYNKFICARRVQKVRTDRKLRPRRWRVHFLWSSVVFCMSSGIRVLHSTVS